MANFPVAEPLAKFVPLAMLSAVWSWSLTRRAGFSRFRRILFRAADKLETALKQAKADPEILIPRTRNVLAMDATGHNVLEDLYEKLHRKGKHFILTDPLRSPT